MTQVKEIWGLFRIADKKKFEGLSLSELKLLYRVLPSNLRSQYLFWNPRQKTWIQFQEFKQSLFDESVATQPEADEPFAVRDKSNSPLRSITQSEVTSSSNTAKLKVFESDQTMTSQLSLDPRAARDARNEVRYDRRFRVRIFTPSGPVKNATLDASMKGLRLELPLPSGLPDFFHVEVQVSSDKRISLLCSAIKEKNGEPVHRVKIHKNDNPVLFKAVLFNAA